jgi:hypothetical protein
MRVVNLVVCWVEMMAEKMVEWWAVRKAGLREFLLVVLMAEQMVDWMVAMRVAMKADQKADYLVEH